MPQPPDSPSGAWGEFPNTVLHFTEDPSFTVDLREPVTPAHQECFTALGLEQTFAIISAQNPKGKSQSLQENQILAMKLHQELAATCRGTAYVSLDACSPDHAHCEASVAVSLSQDEAVALARRYEQLAIFWFDGTRFWIIPALASSPAVSLPVHLTDF